MSAGQQSSREARNSLLSSGRLFAKFSSCGDRTEVPVSLLAVCQGPTFLLGGGYIPFHSPRSAPSLAEGGPVPFTVEVLPTLPCASSLDSHQRTPSAGELSCQEEHLGHSGYCPYSKVHAAMTSARSLSMQCDTHTAGRTPRVPFSPLQFHFI